MESQNEETEVERVRRQLEEQLTLERRRREAAERVAAEERTRREAAESGREAAERVAAEERTRREEAKSGREAAERVAAEERTRREEAKRRRKEAERQIEEAKRRREEVEADFAAIEALGKGTYFTTYNGLWNVQSLTFGEANVTNLTRNPGGSGKELREKIPYYDNTAKFAGDDNYGVTDAPSLSRSESTTNNRLNWPRHVLETTIGNDSEGSDETFTPVLIAGELAHLVPASPGRANQHLYVAPLIFGIPHASLEFKKKLIHGSKEKDGKRENDVGVKHFPTNKIRLHGYSNYCDRHPHVLIIPILTVDETKAWNGTGYDALFLIGVKQDEFGTKQEAPILSTVAGGTLLNNVKFTKRETASHDEIEKARHLLEACILALAHSMKHDVALNEEVWNGIPQEVQEQVGCLPSLDKAPCPSQNWEEENPRVLKVRFGSVGTAGASRGHPAPDPMLLAMKAANNWSAAHGVRLLAVAEESEEDKMSDRSLLALEWHMEWVQEIQEHERNQEISGMEIVCGMCEEVRCE